MDLLIYSDIGNFGDVKGFTAKDAQAYLSAHTGDTVNVRINSYGGEVYEGYAIYNALRNSGKTIHVYIDGICASIASLIAMAGDKIFASPLSELMIHKPLVQIQGNADILRKQATDLDQIEKAIISAYKSKSNLDDASLAQMMRSETYISAKDAKDYGFVDEVLERKVVAFIDPSKIGTLNKNKMSETKLMNLLNKIEARLTGKVVNMDATLSDGTSVYVETKTEGELAIGDKVFIVSEDGNLPAPDGEHELADGTIITTEGGVITEILQPEAEQEEVVESTMDEEKEEMKKEIEALKAAIAEKENAVNILNEEKTLVNSAVEELRSEILNMKKKTVGDVTNVGTKVPQNIAKPTESIFDSLIDNVKNKLKQ